MYPIEKQTYPTISKWERWQRKVALWSQPKEKPKGRTALWSHLKEKPKGHTAL